MHNKVFFVDLFGVLLGPDYSELIEYIFSKTNESKINIYQKVFDENSMKFFRREISFETYFLMLQYKLLKGELVSKKKFNYYWNRMNIGATPVVDEFLRLKNKYKIYILTNTTTGHILELKKKFNFIDQFSGIITSDLSKALKPNKAIFLYGLNLAQSKPQESVFIDDGFDNVNAARKMGIIAHQYTNFKDFKIFLDKFLKELSSI